MKNTVFNLKMLLYRDKNCCIVIFFLFFSFYLFTSALLSYVPQDGDNFMFDLDSGRAYDDFTVIQSERNVDFSSRFSTQINHNRVKVHPLVLIMFQGIVRVLGGIFVSSSLAIAVLESAAAAGIVVAIFGILKNQDVNIIFNTILTFVWGFSLQTIISASVPETYIFAGFFLSLFWYYCNKEKQSSDFTMAWNDICMLVIFGILNFGVTITNYVYYLIGLIYLLWIKLSGMKNRLKWFININLINLLCIELLTFIQRITWPGSPSWLIENVKGFFHLTNFEYEEFSFIDTSFSVEKITDLFKNLIFTPFLSPSIKNNGYGVGYGDYNVLTLTVVCLITMLSLIVIIYAIYRTKSRRLVTMSVAILYTLCFHFIYCYMQSYLYSLFWFYLLLICVGLSVSSLNKKIQNIFIYIYSVFLIFDIVNSAYRFRDTYVMVKNIFYIEPVLGYKKSIVIALTISGVFILIFRLITNRVSFSLEAEFNSIVKKVFVSGMVLSLICALFTCIYIYT